MTTEFERGLATARRDLEAARSELLRVIDALTDADLDKSRRGAWSVRAVLDHLTVTDWWYAKAVASLRELESPPRQPISQAPATGAHAAADLRAAREALVTACDGVDEDIFYRLRKVGPQEYSVLSILENSADHDREHAHQIQKLVAAP